MGALHNAGGHEGQAGHEAAQRPTDTGGESRLDTVTRRQGAGAGARAVLAVVVAASGTIASVTPAFARAAAPDRAKARADAVKQAKDLVTQFRQHEAIDLLMAYAGDKDPDVFAGIASAYSKFANPPNKLKAVEWINKAIELKPTNTSYLASRAGYHGDAGWRYHEQRLADRMRVVELAEATSPEKTASAGNYADLAGAHNAFVVPRGGGAVDEARRDLVMELRSKAIALDETYGRLLDRAELVDDRYRNPGMGRDDVSRAIWLVEHRMDPVQPGTWYQMGQLKRRIAGVDARMSLLGAMITPSGERAESFRPGVAAYRQQAVDAYQRYIDAWEASGRDFLKLGSGADALNNQASALRDLGGANNRKAVENYDTLIGINPTNPGYWRNRSRALDSLGERGAARAGYEMYLKLNGVEDAGDAGATLARLANG